uniref:Pheromone-processing carboxypeptidase KEX1 n=1 Tax=Zeugodacus cucurbitae TaxID=28588 RepID=A0A0A1XRQ6_ZEUCU
MYVSRLPKLALFVLVALTAILDHANMSPIDETSRRSELSDLNKIPLKRTTSLQPKPEPAGFKHYDEDSIRIVTDLSEDQRLKYDVEVLEVRDVNKETAELEERFRGPAIKMDTDNFVSENIEVNAVNADDKHKLQEASNDNDDDDNDDDDDDEDDDGSDTKHSHMILTMVLVFVALFSISLYVALVLWRSYLERRYAMRELLVNDDDDFYLPSSESVDRRW